MGGLRGFVTDEPNVPIKDTKSARYIQATQFKKNRLRKIIYNQLQYYSKTGKRLLLINEATMEAGWNSVKTGRKYAKNILEEIFKDSETSSLIYDLVFGNIRTTSYQKIKADCIHNGLILKMTPTQFFEMMKNRGDTKPSDLRVEVQCKKEGHKFDVMNGLIAGCLECSIEAFKTKPFDYQSVLTLADNHHMQAVSFKDDTQQLTESEFNQLLEAYKNEHQDPDDYKSMTAIFINLKWRCLECDHVFERSYNNIYISKVDQYCPRCVSRIDQQRTLEAAQKVFHDYTVQSFQSNHPLTKCIPRSRILLMPKYRIISHDSVHIDVFGVISINGREIKIAIEHQGPQYTSFESFLAMKRPQDEKRGIYKSDAEYRDEWNSQLLVTVLK